MKSLKMLLNYWSQTDANTTKRYYINVKFEKYGTYTFEARSKEHAIEMYNDGDYGLVRLF